MWPSRPKAEPGTTATPTVLSSRLGEFQVVLQAQLGDGPFHIAEGVERAVSGGAGHAGDLVQRADHIVMTLLEGLDHGLQHVLRAVQRGFGRDLRDGGRVGGGLRLHVLHGA
jgi:hypothetical protein